MSLCSVSTNLLGFQCNTFVLNSQEYYGIGNYFSNRPWHHRAQQEILLQFLWPVSEFASC